MQNNYKRLDLSKLNMSHEIISMEEALQDVTPMVFPRRSSKWDEKGKNR